MHVGLRLSRLAAGPFPLVAATINTLQPFYYPVQRLQAQRTVKHSRISSWVGVMFAKAVQDHSPVKPPRGLIPAQQSRHSTSLKPSRTTAVHGSRHAWPPANNPLKRTAAQSNTTEPLVRQLDSNMSKTGLNAVLKFTGDNERVGKLHDTVYFDEDDFEDDADIDLDAEEPFLRKSSSNTKITYPALTALPEVAYPNLHHPTDATSPDANPSQASGTIPWSSSPSQHKSLPPSQHSSATKLGKRRKLPWVSNSDQDLENNLDSVREANRRTQVSHISKGSHGNLDKPKPPEAVQEIISRYRYQNDPKSNTDDVKESCHGNITPLPIDKACSSLPWNTTASAMKEGQRKLRQGLKKSMSNTVADRTLGKVASSTKKAGVTRVHLSDEQKKVLNLVTEENKSVFFTGSAGTGKSVLLREIIKKLRAKHMHQPDRVAVTASTGLAACNIGGVTLHSFAGIGLGKEDVPELVKKIKRNQKAKSRWMRTKILIVDEISMVDGELFDKLEGVARSIRNNGRPFGGIQLVITGDFFQLPPVPDYGKIAKFSFDANTWNTSIEYTIGLTQVFRQKDPVFANMLNEMRLGRLSTQSISTFHSLKRPLAFHDDFEATELFSTRHEVDTANNGRMQNLDGKIWTFRADDGGSIQDIVQRDKLLSNCMAPQSISLKRGAQVMLIKNIDESLVNGSIGRVIAFMDEKTFDIYHDDEENFQAPETMDITDKSQTESRMKIKAMMNKSLVSETSHKWPLVRFAIADGTSRDLLVQKESWKIELPSGEVQASRSQVPLILAWALSIHKAQGQTLERVKVDLGKIFEKGQAYVALSRATCQEGLQILRFDPKKVMAHEKVRSFYDSLYSVNKASNFNVEAAPRGATAAKDSERGRIERAHGFYDDDDDDALLEMYG